MTRFKELLGVERVRRFVQACVCTAYLKDSDKPVSFILVAEPESAKTETLKMVSEPAGKRRPIHFYNFATAYGIQKDLLAKIQSGELRFLFSSDLQAVTGMSPKTRAQLMTFLIGIIEEGFKASHSYAVHFDSEVAIKVGWGATVQPSYLWATDKNRNRVMRKWIQSGFASRVMFFSYSYSPEIVQQIFDRQSSGYSALAEPLRLPTKDYTVSIPQKFDLALQQYAKMIAEERGDYGIRAHRDLRQLAKALALMRALDA